MQFTTRTLLYAMAFVGIALTGSLASIKILEELDPGPQMLGLRVVVLAMTICPVWMPVVVAGYALGCKSLGWKTLAILVAIELAAIVVALIGMKLF